MPHVPLWDRPNSDEWNPFERNLFDLVSAEIDSHYPNPTTTMKIVATQIMIEAMHKSLSSFADDSLVN